MAYFTIFGLKGVNDWLKVDEMNKIVKLLQTLIYKKEERTKLK